MDLIQFLYCVMSYYLNGNKLEAEAKPVLKRILDTSFGVSIPYLGTVLTSMEKGQPIDYPSLSTALQVFRKEYLASASAKVSFANMVGLFAKWFRTSSDSSYRALVKNSALCDDPYIRGFISEEKVDQAQVKKVLEKVSKSLGFGGKTLDAEEKKLAKAKDPEKFKDYLKLSRQYGLAWKQEVSEFVRVSGRKTLPFSAIEKQLKKKGIEHSMPSGFIGNVDADGNWYTKDNRLINGVPSASMFPEVVMNDTGEGDWVFQAVRADGGLGNYFYAKDTLRKNSVEKFAFTSVFIKKLPQYRTKWLANVKSPFDYTSIPAISSVIIELLYLSSQRVGTNAGGNEGGSGFGMSSILCKHVTIRANGEVLIAYKGKDAVPFKFVLSPGTAKDKVICRVLKDLTDNKKPNEPVFTRDLKNGTYSRISAGSVTSFFKSITGGANIHKLRTAAGSSLFDQLTKEYFARLGDKKITMAAALELIKKAATVVGKKLGHVTRDARTGTMKVAPGTSLKNYIDLDLQVGFFKHFGLPIPSYLEKFMETDRTITSAAEKPGAEDAPEEDLEDAEEEDILKYIEDNMQDPAVLETIREAEGFLSGETQRRS